jgi:8-oxo-dGTP pyrophosphatase MutT (NUDIX family)
VADTTELKQHVLADVLARNPVDERERVSIARFAAEIERLERPFDEHADSTHVTASALVVGPRGIVLHRHRILGVWIQPGGHVDASETPWDAAVREAQEETGIVGRLLGGDPPQLAHVDVHPGPHGHTHLDLRYLIDGGAADPAPPPGESPEVGWFGWAEAPTVAEPCMDGILRSLAARYGS